MPTAVWPQRPRAGVSSWTAVGGNSPWRCPTWPGLPPALRGVADVERRCGFVSGGSDAGGRWDVVESCLRRAYRASTRLWRSRRWASSCGTARAEAAPACIQTTAAGSCFHTLVRLIARKLADVQWKTLRETGVNLPGITILQRDRGGRHLSVTRVVPP